VKIVQLDHIVLTVKDIDTTVEFYQSVLGMSKETFAAGRVALKFGKQKINLHQQGKEFEPKAQTPLPGSEDLCFITDSGIEQAMAEVKSLGVEIIQGPVERTGANGAITSFYFRDPDGNLIEVAKY
jgi:catechol 2,3-dioxygenase-like lactoylglutathione lyase family enzyme